MGLGHLFYEAVEILRAAHPSEKIISLSETPGEQGYASTTYDVVLAADSGSELRNLVLQLRDSHRPLAPSKDMELVGSLLGPMAPLTTRLEDYVYADNGKHLLCYEMTRISGITLHAFSQRTNYLALLPRVANGLGDILGKCCTGAPLADSGRKRLLIKDHLDLAANSTDPYLLPFKSDYVRISENVDFILDLPAEITNCDLNPTNIMASEDGIVTGLIDWEVVGGWPLGWNTTLIHSILRGEVTGDTYILRDNAADLEARFWTSFFREARVPVTAELLRKIEAAMKTAALFECILGTKCNDPQRMPQLRMELDYVIPMDVQ